MDYSMLSFFGLTIVVFAITILAEKLDEKQELKLRQRDSKLQNYYGEMNNDSNDGWTKSHYKQLYEKRLKVLKRKKK
jgi:outer membrane lipoprotein-sorting protein